MSQTCLRTNRIKDSRRPSGERVFLFLRAGNVIETCIRNFPRAIAQTAADIIISDGYCTGGLNARHAGTLTLPEDFVPLVGQ